ncbi:DUF4041 domain-containing protein [Telmatobacter sp. DSM 110680]|uniref:DUF4041 domain-containing protein n=1 Tax=Telmatobacter sp. DSM 110680 TaxID=3036704 RepID=A0AAU7DJV8_9BACT
MQVLLICVAVCSASAAIFFGLKYRAIVNRFRPVLSLEEEAERVRQHTEEIKASSAREIEDAKGAAVVAVSKAKAKAADLTVAYNKAKETYDRLQLEVSLLQSTSDDMSFGLYRPEYSFETSEKYKDELQKVYEQKKECIKNDKAAIYPSGWTVNNNLAEGKRMIKKQVKIMLRAFNGECDAAVARVSWNNATRMIERIQKSFDAMNLLGEVVKTRLSDPYLKLCLAELRLTHEYEMKKQEEKEKAREDRERMREEERAQKDFERAQREAAIEKAKAEKAIAAAHEALQTATGEHLEAIQIEIQVLEKRMADAQSKQDRAVSMSQLTRMGHVYVISNVGSFGENVFKVGMTRRLEPDDRIQELSGAAVPFGFDIHAMIFSNDAPGLETALHTKFADRRLNLVNPRKEYFRVTLDEISQFARSQGLDVEFVDTPEAKQYRESEAMRLKAKLDGEAPKAKADAFPEQLFAVVEDD